MYTFDDICISSIQDDSIETFWSKKPYKKKWQISQRYIFQISNSSCTIFGAKILEYSFSTYCSRDFDNFCFEGIRTFWTKEIMQEKLPKFIINFELYQHFINNLCLKTPQYPQILQYKLTLKGFLLLLLAFTTS